MLTDKSLYAGFRGYACPQCDGVGYHQHIHAVTQEIIEGEVCCACLGMGRLQKDTEGKLSPLVKTIPLNELGGML